MTADDERETPDGPDQGFLTGDKKTERHGVVGKTSDDDPRFDPLSGDEPNEHKGRIGHSADKDD
jgi:hypothetical protein